MRIAFLGKMGTGKTTAAKLLYTAMGFEKVSLAGPLKEIAKLRDKHLENYEQYMFLMEYALEVLPDPVYSMAYVEYRHPRTGQPITTTPADMLVRLWEEDLIESQDTRELWQRIGTDSGRFIKPAIWIDHFARNLKAESAVLDDVRFVNEGEALAKLGFLKIKVTVPEELRRARIIERDGEYQENRQGHASETELDEIVPDVLIHNIGSEKQLYAAVNDTLHKFRQGEYEIGQETAEYRPSTVVSEVPA